LQCFRTWLDQKKAPVEVTSKSQTTGQMDVKGGQMQAQLPETMRGEHQTVTDSSVLGRTTGVVARGVGPVSSVIGFPGAIADNIENPEMSATEFLARATGTYELAVESGILPKRLIN
jgi:hypothetical protein